jgi:hypothetical protein
MHYENHPKETMVVKDAARRGSPRDESWKIRQVSGEFSTFGPAKNHVPNYIIKLLHFAL